MGWGSDNWVLEWFKCLRWYFFFGSFIFNREQIKEKGYIEVIDGQQRLLTVTILIAVLRDLAKQIDMNIATLFQHQDIAVEDRDGKESYRIECGDSAKLFYEDYIQSFTKEMSKAKPNSPEE